MGSRWFAKKCGVMPDFFHEGTVHLAGNLKSLEMCTATVESVCVYKTPLQQGPLQALGAIMHHFLVVEVSDLSHPTRGHSKGGFLIRAEKAGRDGAGKNTGITVKDVHYVEEESFVEKHRVADLNVSIPMAQLLHILTKHSADYDLFTDNCWRYADATCRALVKAFGELRPMDGRVMDSHLQQIPTLVMPVDMAMTVVGYGLLVTTAACVTRCVTRYVYKRFFTEKKEEDAQIEGEASPVGLTLSFGHP